jgi:hypothetical protein
LAKHEPHVLPAQDDADKENEDQDPAVEVDDDKEEEKYPIRDGGRANSLGDIVAAPAVAQKKPRVTYDFYNEHFRRFDLAFGTPVVDSCATCDEFPLKIKAAEDEQTADALRVERRAHLREADRGYAMRKHDHDLAKQSRLSDSKWVCPAKAHASWDGLEYVCSDMAGVLCTPKVPTNKAFYLRKLKTYCYGMYSGQAEQNSLIFWYIYTTQTQAQTNYKHTHAHTHTHTGTRPLQKKAAMK